MTIYGSIVHFQKSQVFRHGELDKIVYYGDRGIRDLLYAVDKGVLYNTSVNISVCVLCVWYARCGPPWSTFIRLTEVNYITLFGMINDDVTGYALCCGPLRNLDVDLISSSSNRMYNLLNVHYLGVPLQSATK